MYQYRVLLFLSLAQGGGATVNDPSCGIRRVLQSRVIGGTDARKGAWPWQVGMYVNGRFICGGTLIAPNWILTASHCVVSSGRERSASSFEIVVGDLHRSLNDTTEQKHQVELVIAHPNYNRRSINNDIALMKLKTPVLMNDHVLTACIPNKTDVIRVGARCFITGKYGCVFIMPLVLGCAIKTPYCFILTMSPSCFQHDEESMMFCSVLRNILYYSKEDSIVFCLMRTL